MVSNELFQVREYEAMGIEGKEIRPVYLSQPMCLRDASRFAGALSYARGAYVEVISGNDSYKEWWYAGALWSAAKIPTIHQSAAQAA